MSHHALSWLKQVVISLITGSPLCRSPQIQQEIIVALGHPSPSKFSKYLYWLNHLLSWLNIGLNQDQSLCLYESWSKPNSRSEEAVGCWLQTHEQKNVCSRLVKWKLRCGLVQHLYHNRIEDDLVQIGLLIICCGTAVILLIVAYGFLSLTHTLETLVWITLNCCCSNF